MAEKGIKWCEEHQRLERIGTHIPCKYPYPCDDFMRGFNAGLDAALSLNEEQDGK
jgi:hypothetical protein